MFSECSCRVQQLRPDLVDGARLAPPLLLLQPSHRVPHVQHLVLGRLQLVDLVVDHVHVLPHLRHLATHRTALTHKHSPDSLSDVCALGCKWCYTARGVTEINHTETTEYMTSFQYQTIPHRQHIFQWKRI